MPTAPRKVSITASTPTRQTPAYSGTNSPCNQKQESQSPTSLTQSSDLTTLFHDSSAHIILNSDDSVSALDESSDGPNLRSDVAVADGGTAPLAENRWTAETHRAFVKAIYEIGKKHASPSVILDNMNNENNIVTKERVKSHLQKYRIGKTKTKDAFLVTYDKWMKNTLETVKEKKLRTSEALASMTDFSCLASGDLAGFLSLSCILDDMNEHASDLDIDVKNFSNNVEGLLELGGQITFPKLTKQEQGTPLGMMMTQIAGCFEMLQAKLEEQRQESELDDLGDPVPRAQKRPFSPIGDGDPVVMMNPMIQQQRYPPHCPPLWNHQPFLTHGDAHHAEVLRPPRHLDTVSSPVHPTSSSATRDTGPHFHARKRIRTNKPSSSGGGLSPPQHRTMPPMGSGYTRDASPWMAGRPSVPDHGYRPPYHYAAPSATLSPPPASSSRDKQDGRCCCCNNANSGKNKYYCDQYGGSLSEEP